MTPPTETAERLAQRSKQFTLPVERMRNLRAIPTGRSYKLKFTRQYHLCVRLWDNFGKEVLKRVKYKLTGDKGASFEGETDDSGCLTHQDVPREEYSLEVWLEDHKEPFKAKVSWVAELGKPIDQRVRDVGLYKLSVQILDTTGKTPVPDVPYVARGEGEVKRGKTDEEGKIEHPGVPMGVFTLVFSPGRGNKKYCTRVPSVEVDAEPLQQRVLGLEADASDDEERHLRARLFDHFGKEPLKNLAYKIAGADGKSYAGTTDGEGKLEHKDVPDTSFTVKVTDPDTDLELETGLPWVEDDACVDQRVRGFGVGILHVRLFDKHGRKPLAGFTVQASAENYKRQLKSDTRGMLGPVEAPHGVVDLAVKLPDGRFASTRVPTVELGGMPISQRVLGA